MDIGTLSVILFVFIAINAGVLWYFLVHKRGSGKEEGQGILLLQQQIQEMTRTLDTKLGESAKEIRSSMKAQLGESTRIVREVTEGLTKLRETNKQVIKFSDQLKQLQDVLKNPKQRGILGEYYLETVLQNVLPPDSFKMQYSFKGGDIVDAVVFVKDKIVPIDSKFSLENYNRMIEAKDDTERERFEKAFVNDMKLRITETAKYIKPEEKTTEYAFMFIPSEGVYYDLLSNKVGSDNESLIYRAAVKHKVIIVSPTSFLAYLQTVLQFLNAMEIEEKSKDIVKNVRKLDKHIDAYKVYYTKLGNSLTTTINHYNTGFKEIKKIDKDVLRITGDSSGGDVLTLDKPDMDD